MDRAAAPSRPGSASRPPARIAGTPCPLRPRDRGHRGPRGRRPPHVEDVALVLGEAIALAGPLRDHPIRRCGRPHGRGHRPRLGRRRWTAVRRHRRDAQRADRQPAQNLPHALEALCRNSGITLHLEAGVNDHHVAEAAFKALAQSLRGAVEIDRTSGIPSTKASCDRSAGGGGRPWRREPGLDRTRAGTSGRHGEGGAGPAGLTGCDGVSSRCRRHRGGDGAAPLRSNGGAPQGHGRSLLGICVGLQLLFEERGGRCRLPEDPPR